MPPALIHTSWTFLAEIAESAARSLALGCFAAVALSALRVRTVRMKLLVWRVVLVAALAMPLMTLIAPPVRVLVPIPKLGQLSAQAPAQASGSAQTTVVHDSRIAANAGIVEPVAETPARTSNPEAPSRTPARSTQGYLWVVSFLAIYALVGLYFLVRLFIGLRLGQRLERSARPITDSHALHLLIGCGRRLGLAGPPLLAESPALVVPLTLGVRCHVILLPADWGQWEASELEAVLTHEVSHISRHDPLILRLALIHRAIFWFNPLAWWLERHLADLAEEASDEAALAGGADRRRYAEMLVEFLGTLEASRQRVWWQGVSMAKTGQAERRVERILAWRGAMPNKLKKSLAIGLLAIGMPVVALTATLHTSMYTWYDEQQPATPPAPAAPATPAASGVTPTIAPGPAPQAPSATPVAPASPTPAPTATATPEAAPAVTADAAANAETQQQIERTREALERAKAELRAAQSDTSRTASEEQMRAYRAAIRQYEREYARAVAGYEREYRRAVAAQEQSEHSRYGGYQTYGDYGSGPRFVIVSKDSDSVTMSGSEEDAEHARALRSKINGDFIWFQRDEKSYIIRDQATVERAKALWKPQEELGRKQEELGKQQEALGKQQEELGEKMEKVRVKIPDMTAELQKLEAEIKQLSANGGTMEQIGDLQSEIGELQSRIGDIQGDAGRQQGEIGRQQGELGRKQGQLGRQQGELGRRQGELAREANRQMKQLLDEAMGGGLAKPE